MILGLVLPGAKYGSTWQHKVHQRHNVFQLWPLSAQDQQLHVLGEDCMESAVVARTAEVLGVPGKCSSLVTRAGTADRVNTLAVGASQVGAYVMAGARCRYTELSEGQ